MADLEIRTPTAPPGVAIVEVDGAVTAQNTAELGDAISRRIGARDLCLVLVFHNVPYVNSAAVECLIETSAELGRRGGGVFLVDVPAKVRLMLETLGVAPYFRIESGAEAAIAEAERLAARSRACPRLVLLKGHGEYPIVEGALRIGSDPKSTVVIRHPRVEDRHAEVLREGDRYLVRDLGSRCGTWVGDRRVIEETLRPGDVIRIGDARLMFVAGEGA